MDILGKNADRRNAARKTGLKSGVALSVDGMQREACVVDNFSEAGALLIVEQPELVPEDLVLMIDGQNDRFPAHVLRREKSTVAVSFLTRETTDAANSEWVFAPDQDNG